MNIRLITPKGDLKKYGTEVMKHYVGKGVISAAMKQEMRVLYKLASGVLEEKDYSYVLNPLGEEQRKRDELKGDPARLRNYDIISPVINVYIGDFIARGTKFQAVNPDYDIEDERLKEEKRLQVENLMAAFRQELQQQAGIDTEMNNEVLPQQEIKKRISGLQDTEAIKSQKALDYIRYSNEMDRKYRLGFFDYITVGKVYTYRDAFGDDTHFEVVNPIDVNYVAPPDTIFIEDADAVWRDMRMTGPEIIDKFSDIINNDIIKYIDSKKSSGGVSQFFTDNVVLLEGYKELMTELGSRVNPPTSGFLVRHMVWKSRRRLGKLIEYDDFGNEVGYIEVDDDFVPRQDETVRWEYVNEIVEGYCIDDIHYFGFSIIPFQRGSLGKEKAKLPYNGRTYGNRTSIPMTPVKKGKYFQELHNIVKYRMERTLAKNKDKILPIPLGAFNDSKMDMFQTMYYTDYHGFLFYDETKKSVVQALSTIRPIDASLTQYIKAIYEISYSIRQEYYEVVGVPRQKLANIMASDDVGNTQAAISRGNLLGEDLMMTYEEVQEKDYQFLIDISKYVWIDGKKETFLNSDSMIDSINIDGEEYASTRKKVFIKGTKEERRKLEALRAQAQAFAQNGYKATAIGEIIGSNNFEELMQKLDRFEKELQEAQQSAAQSQQQADMTEKQLEAEKQQKELEFKYYEGEANRLNERVLKAMETQSSLVLAMMGKDEGSLSPEMKTAFETVNNELAQINLKREELEVKKEQIRTQLEIAKENKNKYDFIRGDSKKKDKKVKISSKEK